ncbi:MAG: PTS ascorbate transporter subunit IIC [Firmicutes bacterium]|nr:PTS ascorbate transporter subunit IIC [Bacillota bacterium]
MDLIRTVFLFIVENILSEAAFLVGLVVLIGMLAQKKPAKTLVGSTVKATVGFLLIDAGAKSMGITLLPVQPLLQSIFNMDITEVNLDAAIGSGMAAFGATATLIFAFGFLVNVLLARITKYKYIHLSAHVSFFYAGLIAALLTVNTGLSTLWITIVGSLMLGVYLTASCAMVAPLMKHVPGGEGFTLGHSSSIGIVISGHLGKLFAKGKRSLEEIKLPDSLSFLRETTIALSVIMTLFFVLLVLLAGGSFVHGEVSGGQNMFIFAIMQGLQFGVGITIIITGVRMMLGEVVAAFHGISQKIVPNAMPGLDVPLLFPNHPTCVIVGFLSSLVAATLGMVILAATHYPIVVFPPLIPVFFTGAITAIFGNATGGRVGAIAGSFVNGLILIFGQALLLPSIGAYESVMRVLSETDYAFFGPIIAWILQLFG